jgi:excinuclease ABC subunit A
LNNRQIVLKKVKVHNLKNVDLTLNPYELIVFTGVSGSGKSSLAFDTIFLEGQRRYIETLPSSLKRFVEETSKPDAEVIQGLSPTIAIEQKTVLKTPRSTVGTITGIYDYLRVLYSKIGIPHCPISNEIVKPQSREKILSSIENLYMDKKIIILSPYIKNKKSSLKDELSEIQKKGFTKIRVDQKIYDLSENQAFDPKKEHDLEIVVDRIKTDKNDSSRLNEAIALAMDLSKGTLIILDPDNGEEKLFSEYAFSPKSGLSYNALKPQDFSFNHPDGMCKKCQGLAYVYEFDLEKIINSDLSISEDCCSIAGHYNTVRYKNIYDNLAKIYKFSTKTPWKNLPDKAKKVFLYGTDEKWLKMKFVHPKKNSSWVEFVSWKGVINEAHKRLNIATSDIYRKHMQALMTKMLCDNCKGARINPYPANTTINDKKIQEVSALTIVEALDFFKNLKLTSDENFISKDLVFEITKKLNFLINVGLHYLTIDRMSPTLSGGESQRVRLAAQIGSNLSGTTYVLDEPSIGLHPFDHNKLIATLIALKNAKNTVIVVEHDKDTILAADTIVDIGPKAGKEGGEIIAVGKVEDIIKAKNSLTGQYLSYKRKIPDYPKRKISSDDKITLTKCRHNNLKNIDLSIYLNTLTCITGVSGSGKSSLISDTLFPAISNFLTKTSQDCGEYEKILGIEKVDKIIFVDQSPIGRTIRSNPATYTKLFDDIRELFSTLPESKMKGFLPSHFSFNVKEGTCSYCKGLGFVKIDMDFMEDASSTCMQCHGKRFSPEILSIYYKDKNIFDVLEMDINEASSFFEAIPHIKHKLDLLNAVGLGYLPIGQSATTLSGGEAQRIKLAKELIRPTKGHTVYILDEPTTGLHFYDIEKLIQILQKLVDQNNTVIIVEHNMDLVKTADWVIDLGPKGGKEGGEILFQGRVEEIIKTGNNTGLALKKAMVEEKLKSKPSPKSKDLLKNLIIRNATQNNLKNISAEIPHGKMTIFTGPSGSGKTSLAFDTIYQEGQIRYMESLDTFSRQFLTKAQRPSVEKIENIFPPISIEQKAHLLNPRSTVGTITEIFDYLRIIYSHIGEAYCPQTNERIKNISPEYILDNILSLKEDEKIQVLAPIELKSNDNFSELKTRLTKLGFLRIRLNKNYYNLDEEITFDSSIKNEIFLVVDRLKVSKNIKPRLLEAINIAKKFSDGKIVIAKEKEDLFFNLSFSSEKSGIPYPAITTQTFSFNSEKGMCLECQGLGYLYGTDLLSKIEAKNATIIDVFYIFFNDDEIEFLRSYFKNIKIDIDEKIKYLSEETLGILLNGSKISYKVKKASYRWRGLNETIAELAKHSTRQIKEYLIPLMDQRICPACNGKRLNPLARNVKINNLSITDFCSLSIESAYKFIDSIKLDESNKKILLDTLNHIKLSLGFLIEIGLDYISLDRAAPTLSGGEMQRIRLAKQLGSYLSSCIYILDEPTVGLHPHNTYLLARALNKLKELGNTLIVVEHDEMIIKQADYILDFGPKAGVHGGQILARGSYDEIISNPDSLTGQYLSRKKSIDIPKKRRNISERPLKIINANLHNLKNINVEIPINAITCITGVSGSGKSTLASEIIKEAASSAMKKRLDSIELDHAKVTGLKNFDSLITLDQSPIGQTIRADVGTYSEAMPLIRALYADLLLAKTKGLKPRHFSYNHISGMCKTCFGIGHKKINLQYLPPLSIICEACHGYRLNPISLEVTYKNKHIGHILDLTIDEAILFFEPFPKILKKLNVLKDVGLNYLKLGQELNTLSGGEAQRLKLAKELSKRRSNRTLYIFDEPTVGLHFIDIENLLKIFHALADKNNTLIIIEHNLDVIANADYIIDIGPDAGEKGGKIVAAGSPEEIIKNKISYTARYLKPHLSLK